MAGETCYASLYTVQLDFGGVTFDGIVPPSQGIFQLRSLQSFVALFTDACWTTAEVSRNKVE